MEENNKVGWQIMHVISWIIFIGLCIKTGSILISFLVSLFVNPAGGSDLFLGLDLSALHNYHLWYYVCLVSILVYVTGRKAYIFYLVTRFFSKINLTHPFSQEVYRLISSISYVAFEIGIFLIISNAFVRWLSKRGVIFSDMHDYLGSVGEFLLLGGVIFVIAQVFKRGIAIQSENELTV
ncbi:DUF2975 domain-containing protein [Pararhodonellum marinum]|uniref:DUF2975 domain-containing protein n=1 Tax=Pararhodonellum marinum TaxID=2755358 RepID=UPI0018908D48|nr:DUF2975 domain-containing protein [Pararhodonellum marinum]